MEDLWKNLISGTWEDLTKDRKAVLLTLSSANPTSV